MKEVYPSAQEYQKALQNDICLQIIPDLKGSRTEVGMWGMPRVWSGGFAYIFHLYLKDHHEKALRCFHASQAERALRYKEISNYLQQSSLPFLTRFSFYEQGINVNNNFYPVVVMDWIEGKPLHSWIQENLNRVEALENIHLQFKRVIFLLQTAGIAHGDLQHENIIVDSKGNLRLVDYDGMYVPSLSYMTNSLERGHYNYQHPQRNDEFNAHLDRFPAIIIQLSLLALQEDPSLWQRYAAGRDNFLFTQADFLDPDHSPLLNDLEHLSSCRPYISKFRAICHAPFEDIPTASDFFTSSENLALRHSAKDVLIWQKRPIIQATNYKLLQTHISEMIEIIGKVVDYEFAKTRDDRRFVRLLFEREMGRTKFVALIFDQALQRFDEQKITFADYRNKWITMTRYLDGYGEDPTLGPRPQCYLDHPSQIAVIPPEEAKQKLSTTDNIQSQKINSGQISLPEDKLNSSQRSNNSSGKDFILDKWKDMVQPTVTMTGGEINFSFHQSKPLILPFSNSSAPKPPFIPYVPESLIKKGFESKQSSGVNFVLPPFCHVLKGQVLVGSDPIKDLATEEDELPQHIISLDTFGIGKYPVTVAEYAYAVHANIVREPPAFNRLDWSIQLQKLDHPVVGVSWADASRYARWLAIMSNMPWRLLTEAEWEYAARGDNPYSIYLWGNTPNSTYAHFNCSSTCPIGSYSRNVSSSGVWDLSGNIWEWCNTQYRPYPYQNDGREDSNVDQINRVLRGGSFLSPANQVRIAYRLFGTYQNGSLTIGFRLGLDSTNP